MLLSCSRCTTGDVGGTCGQSCTPRSTHNLQTTPIWKRSIVRFCRISVTVPAEWNSTRVLGCVPGCCRLSQQAALFDVLAIDRDRWAGCSTLIARRQLDRDAFDQRHSRLCLTMVSRENCCCMVRRLPLLKRCAGGRHNMPPPPASWPLTFWPWKWRPSPVWRGPPLCQF